MSFTMLSTLEGALLFMATVRQTPLHEAQATSLNLGRIRNMKFQSHCQVTRSLLGATGLADSATTGGEEERAFQIHGSVLADVTVHPGH